MICIVGVGNGVDLAVVGVGDGVDLAVVGVGDVNGVSNGVANGDGVVNPEEP
jgi:hypothetical protein